MTAAQELSRNALVEQYLPLAKSVARSFRRQGADAEDLAQEAVTALVEAAEKAAASPAQAVAAYLRRAIRRRLSLYVRQQTPVGRRSRHAADHAALLAETEERLAHALGRWPHDEELCDALGWSYRKLLDVRAGEPQPMDAEQLDERPATEDADHELLASFEEALVELPDYQQRVLRLRAEGLRCDEIAEQLGVCQQRVSAIVGRAVETLQQILKPAA